jgi:hypothetical protein
MDIHYIPNFAPLFCTCQLQLYGELCFAYPNRTIIQAFAPKAQISCTHLDLKGLGSVVHFTIGLQTYMFANNPQPDTVFPRTKKATHRKVTLYGRNYLFNADFVR